MDPKMTVCDAAKFLKVSHKEVYQKLLSSDLPFANVKGKYKEKGQSFGASYFNYSTAKHIFNVNKRPIVVAFQIVKGGTGKTSLASAFAMRANLYGLRVLCIDLDQQGNLTHTFDVDAETVPVMIDILAEDYSFEDAITRVYPGMDLISSRIENALIDEVIKLKGLPLEQVYSNPLFKLKEQYDLIVIDCPPNLGQSVAAVTLAVDMVISPVVPENFALSGLKITANTIRELEDNYKINIPFGIVLNKYDARTILSQDALNMLINHPLYKDFLLQTYIRTSQEFPNAIAKGQTIYDNLKFNLAKDDIDNLTKEILQIGDLPERNSRKKASRSAKLETILV
jgi:chromosome partitioning protein